MPFSARTAAQIRDAALADLRSRYVAFGRDIDISEGSPAYNDFDAFALALEPVDLGAREAANRVLLRYQYGADLDESAADEGTARLPASAARRVVRVSGPPSSSVAVNGATLGAPGGQRFAPVDAETGEPLAAIATDGSGLADVTAECTEAGETGNLPLGTVLTWNSAPLGFSALGTIVAGAGAVDGEEAEGDTALQQRVEDLRRHRPGSGNPAEWRSWAVGCAGVGDAFVHRATLPPDLVVRLLLTPAQLGCVSVLVVRPAPAADTYVQNGDGTLGAGLSPSYSRSPSQGLCDNVAGFIDGTLDSQGDAVRSAARRQLYPAVIHRENWGVVRPRPSPIAVTVGVRTQNGIDDFGFDAPLTVTAAADTTHVTLSSTTNVVVGRGLSFFFAAADTEGLSTVVRGFWAVAVVSAKSGFNLTLATPLPAVPSNGAAVRADPGPVDGPKLWRPVSAAILGVIDALGPGAPTGLGQSARYPDQTDGALASLLPSRLLLAVLSVPGVLDAEVVTPSSAQDLSLGFVAAPGSIIVQRKTF